MAVSNPPPAPAAPYKTLQESASAIYRSMTPLLQRCASLRSEKRMEVMSAEARRSIQQAENLKWQQEAFHRLLNLVCLCNEGLVGKQELGACRREVVGQVESLHRDGEWAEFTRDKLLFLQDLLFAGCISEVDYHAAKKSLILRLAEQGAILDAQDFIFGAGVTSPRSRHASDGKPHSKSARTPTRARAQVDGLLPVYADDRSDNKTSPLKQVMGAMNRLKAANSSTKAGKEKEKEVRRVPHALDFLRPKNCPVRDPPSPLAWQKPLETDSISRHSGDISSSLLQDVVDGAAAATHLDDPFSRFESPTKLTSSPAESVFSCPQRSPPVCVSPLQYKSPGRTGSRFRSILTGLMQKVQGDTEKSPRSFHCSDESDSDDPKERVTKGTWGFELLRPPKKLHFDQPAADDDDDDSWAGKSGAPHTNLSENKPLVDGARGQGPNTVRLKKKVHSKGAPTDFFIDKVLGENIKNELSRIRAEMNNSSQTGQTFTNEQIDAIATRLPVDKTELKRFFPQSWCDRYGDIVLEVVRKEFKDHVGEMENLRKAAKEKRAVKKTLENDENSETFQPAHNFEPKGTPKRSPKVSLNKCFTTVDENTMQPKWTSASPEPKSKLTPRRARNFSRDMGFDNDLDGKLEEEIQKMPFKRVNEYGSHLRA